MRFHWDKKKNIELAKRGRPCFEDAVKALAQNALLIDDENPVHPNQRIFVVEIEIIRMLYHMKWGVIFVG